MIRANVDVVVSRLLTLGNESRQMVRGLTGLKTAEEIVILTQTQIDDAVDAINAQAADIARAYNAAVTAFQATDPIDE